MIYYSYFTKKINLPTPFHQRVKGTQYFVASGKKNLCQPITYALNTPSLQQSVQKHDVLHIHIEDRDIGITACIFIVSLTGWAFHSVISTTLYHTNNSLKYNIMEGGKSKNIKLYEQYFEWTSLMGLVNQQEQERLLKTFEEGKYIYFDGNVIDYIIRG